MAAKIKTNIAASVHDRLLTHAKAQAIDFTAVLMQYGQERFLYRLSISSWCDHFLLKGALLFLVYGVPRPRPTKDIDLLGRSVDSDLPAILKIMQQIAAIPFQDGIEFDPKSVSVSPIRATQEYHGVRVIVGGKLGTTRLKVQVDIGFGDVVAFAPGKKPFPGLLDFPLPVIRVYSKETALAEKLNAIAKLGLTTSRMKDFHDILQLARYTPFSLHRVRSAVKKTFAQRDTDLNLLGEAYSDRWKKDGDKLVQWKSFVRKKGLTVDADFSEVIDLLKTFVGPMTSDTDEAVWDPGRWSWAFAPPRTS